MQSKKKIYAFIFARKNSKRIKDKNIKNLAGLSLIERSIHFAKKLKSIKKIFVSTDSEKIKIIALKLNCEVIIRPKKLTKDDSPELESWRHAINFVQNKYGTDFLFLSLPTTSPLRKNNDVLKCINFVEKKNYDCSLTVTKTNSDPYFNMVIKKNKNFYPIFNNKNSRSKNSFYTITTVAYCAKISFIKKAKHILDGNIKFLEVDFPSSLDIDEISDLKIAELLLKK